jgi:lysophospholipase L1-like esterase
VWSAPPWRTRRTWAAVVAALALTAIVVAAFARRVVFDLAPEPYGESVRRFATGSREVEVRPRSPWTPLPRVLPGPADRWAGGTPHAVTFQLRPPPAGPLVLHVELGDPRSLEPADEILRREAVPPPSRPAPPQLTIAVNGTAVADLDERTRVGGVDPVHHRIRLPAAAPGDDAAVRVSLINAAGGMAALAHVRLVPARPSFALDHLGRRGRFPPECALLVAGSLAALLVWRPAGLVESRARRALRAGGAAAALGLLGLAAVLPGDWRLVADEPRWLWLAVPWVLLLLFRPRPAAPVPVSARPGRRAVRLAGLLGRGLLALGAVILVLLTAELLLRLAFRHARSAADSRSYFAQRAAQLNGLGFREREFPLAKPPATYRIAVLGDSLSWGIGVTPSERFSGRLEHELNARRGPGAAYQVLNFAQPGWDTEDELRALRAVVLGTRPDFVILQWYVNDVENGDRLDRPRPLALLPWAPVHVWLLGHSALFALLDGEWQTLQDTLELVETYPEYLYRRFGDPASPHAAAAAAALRDFVTECRGRGLPMTVVLFPHASPGLVGGRYEYDYLHDRVLETCRAESIRCVDLRGAFAGYRDHRPLWVSPLDPHPSALAHRLAAERLLEAFGPVWLARSRP